MEPTRVHDAFPAPSYRGAQERALADVRDAFQDGNDVVLVRAPTGSGKSLLARAIAGCARQPGGGDPAKPVGAYYTTPQVSQLEDVAGDPLLEDLAIVRGKGNYRCILPGESDTPVDRAPCVRERGFDCDVQHRCPYFSDRSIAANRSIAAMTLAYFMQTAGSDVFGQRDVVVIDEAHGLGNWAEMYATIDLGPDTVPVWDAVPAPAVDDLADAVDYAERVATVCDRRLTELRSQADLRPAEVAERDRCETLRSDCEWFVSAFRDPESPTTWVVDQPDGEGSGVTVRPLNPERYLAHTVWDRGSKFALLSATILDKEAFCAGVGLDPADVALVEVPHTFPVEHRPLFDVARGKMTYEEREETLPKLVETIVRIMAAHPDEKGLIHCHSYDIQAALAEGLADRGVGSRVRRHDRDDRDAQLSTWQRREDPEVFLSVKMEEALDLEGDLARWQVVCKAPFPNTRDSRVAHRLEAGQWDWYYRTALRTVVQACGRIVRAPDDHGATYLADTSLLDLFERAREDLPDWFAAQVDRMRSPALPPASSTGALGGIDGTGQDDPASGTRSRSARRSRSGTGSRSGTRTRSGSAATDSANKRVEDHPLSDVWGE